MNLGLLTGSESSAPPRRTWVFPLKGSGTRPLVYGVFTPIEVASRIEKGSSALCIRVTVSNCSFPKKLMTEGTRFNRPTKSEKMPMKVEAPVKTWTTSARLENADFTR